MSDHTAIVSPVEPHPFGRARPAPWAGGPGSQGVARAGGTRPGSMTMYVET